MPFTSSTPLPIFAVANFKFSFRKAREKPLSEERPDASGEEDDLFTPPPSPGRVDPNASDEKNSLFTPTLSPSRVVLGENDGENSLFVLSSPQSNPSWNPSHGLESNKENNSPLVQLPVAPQNDATLPLSRPTDSAPSRRKAGCMSTGGTIFIAMTGQQTTRGQREPSEPRKAPSRKRKAQVAPSPDVTTASTSRSTTTVGAPISPSMPCKRQRTSNSGGFSPQQSHFADASQILPSPMSIPLPIQRLPPVVSNRDHLITPQVPPDRNNGQVFMTRAPTTLETLTWEQIKYLPLTYLDNDEPPVHAQPGSYINGGFTALQPWWG